MALLPQFSPPAFMRDFDGIAGQREAWHQAVDGWFEASIAKEARTLRRGQRAGTKSKVQFYNPARRDPGGPTVEQPITWNAFPKELLRAFGRPRALQMADTLRPISSYSGSSGFQGPLLERTFYRPQVEYCEWHVTRDPETGKIIRVVFTSEPPEYWQALFGDKVSITRKKEVAFPGDRQRVLHLYHELVGPEVELEDLICHEDIVSADGKNTFARKGQYNPYNKWNTTHGIVHLCAPPNSLSAEIELGADATILRQNRSGRPVVQPDELICCSGYGGANRNSDPTIGSSVNALARLGALVTLPDPVGLYMDHIDLNGWRAPDGKPVGDSVRLLRGTSDMIERLVVEVPRGRGFAVGDLTIGGEPIVYGGQIAECITVKLVGAAAPLAGIRNRPLACTARCCLDAANAKSLTFASGPTSPCPPGLRPAFPDGQGTTKKAGHRPAPEAEKPSRPQTRHHL